MPHKVKQYILKLKYINLFSPLNGLKLNLYRLLLSQSQADIWYTVYIGILKSLFVNI